MTDDAKPRKRKKYVRAVGPRLRRLLYAVLGAFALMAMNGLYLGSVTLTEWWTGVTFQNYFYLWMFLGHLILGLAMIVPVILFGVFHIRNAHNRPNRRAVMAGYALFAVSLVLLGTGVVLTRIEGVIEINDPVFRSTAYWVHVISPIGLAWIYILHRLAGPKIKWRVGVTWATVAGLFALVMVLFHSQDPRQWNVVGPESGEQYFFPSLARTATGDFIPADTLMMDQYCQECHADVHASWSNSVHKLSSFNNPAYLFSVRGTRELALARDGDVQASRFCAGCHDPVPFFSGAFDDPDFDDVNDPTSQAGITCTACHAITHINSPRGNSDYTIEEPVHYPFATSDSSLLRWVNRQLVKGKPGLHKKTFLKPLHKSADFCGTCHKVHLPEELNKYRFLRGQNHYDAHLLSGVSGHGISSFYYPPKAIPDCNTCHMKLVESDDFAAKDNDGSGTRTVHDHQFPSANTAIPYLLGLPSEVIDAHRKFNEGVMRLDLFALRRGATINGELVAPLGPEAPVVSPGEKVLIDAVIRTVKMGHVFTQGTADSNEVWLDVTVRDGDRVVGRSGGVDDVGRVDPWSHFVNVYMLDRDGKRIDRRNAEDIFVPLYNHQIPPGAADVVHYELQVPEQMSTDTLVIDVALRYRKFDTTYMQLVHGADWVNRLPVLTLATDRVTLPVGGAGERDSAERPPLWERFNDYGIGLLRKGDGGSQKGELRQAEVAFAKVEELGRPDGPLNLARLYIKEGRLEDAVDALKRAAAHDPPAPPWSVAWFSAMVDKQNGNFEAAISSLERIIATDFADARARGFDFSKDYRVLNELGQVLIERSKRERGDSRRETRDQLLRSAESRFRATLVIDPENVTAHYSLSWIAQKLGNDSVWAEHQRLHAKYKTDENARDRAIANARSADPAADHAAESVVIYDLARAGRFERSVTEFAAGEKR